MIFSNCTCLFLVINCSLTEDKNLSRCKGLLGWSVSELIIIFSYRYYYKRLCTNKLTRVRQVFVSIKVATFICTPIYLRSRAFPLYRLHVDQSRISIINKYETRNMYLKLYLKLKKRIVELFPCNYFHRHHLS